MLKSIDKKNVKKEKTEKSTSQKRKILRNISDSSDDDELFWNCDINVSEWPPQSPDINPKENLWVALDKNLSLSDQTNKADFF